MWRKLLLTSLHWVAYIAYLHCPTQQKHALKGYAKINPTLDSRLPITLPMHVSRHFLGAFKKTNPCDVCSGVFPSVKSRQQQRQASHLQTYYCISRYSLWKILRTWATNCLCETINTAIPQVLPTLSYTKVSLFVPWHCFWIIWMHDYGTRVNCSAGPITHHD